MDSEYNNNPSESTLSYKVGIKTKL